MLSQINGPLPDSDYIMSNQPVARPVPLTTNTKAGRAASTQKRKEPTSKDGKDAIPKKTKSTTSKKSKATSNN